MIVFNPGPVQPDVNIETDKNRENSPKGVTADEHVHRDCQGKVEVSDDILKW